VPAAQCSQIRALCPLLSAAKSGLCARCSVQQNQGHVSAKHYLCYAKLSFYSYSKPIKLILPVRSVYFACSLQFLELLCGT
jgi:hypothetical protein